MCGFNRIQKLDWRMMSNFSSQSILLYRLTEQWNCHVLSTDYISLEYFSISFRETIFFADKSFCLDNRQLANGLTTVYCKTLLFLGLKLFSPQVHKNMEPALDVYLLDGVPLVVWVSYLLYLVNCTCRNS